MVFQLPAQKDYLTGLFGLIWIHKHFGNFFQFPIPDFHAVVKKDSQLINLVLPLKVDAVQNKGKESSS